MTVYVDNKKYRYRRMYMCHMVADSIHELHQMADQIGVNRKWFQDKPQKPHYDICQTKKALVIKNGAVEVSSKDIIKVLKRNFSI